CGDSIPRVLYLDFLVESLDFEMWNFTCCRAGRARHPCPRCLVTQDLLHDLSRTFTERTTQSMRAVIKRARKAPNATQKEKILVDSGLHDVTHFMWVFRFSDPYRSTMYDLHFAESGEWGHHLWVLTMQLINEFGIDAQVIEAMAAFPRWRGLKHINDPLTKYFTDGETHFNISKTYGKSFAWPKHHFLVHMIQDILTKGVLRNGTTRTGEGMHQEVAQHYMHTNFRDVDSAPMIICS
ncbi:hypothetical protein GGX14DRAFT_358092, partial [Mycena pura]